jgi:hypothetical protein
MKTIVIIGIGKENYNYKKIKGFIDGFKEFGHEVFHYTYLNHDILKKHQQIDILFAETNYLEGIFYNVKNFILWTNTKLYQVINFAKVNNHLNIIFAPKSFMFNTQVNEIYFEKMLTTEYQMVDHEGQDLDFVTELINKKEKINEFTYKIFENLIFTYMPCSKSDLINSDSLKEAKYKFSYFGTGNNRPQVVAALNFLNERIPNQIKFHFVENGGPIDPDQCISYYKESEYVLHEQVNPVILEYSVRIGEATAAGSKIILFETLPLYEKVKLLNKVPEMIKYNSAEEFKLNFDKIETRNLETRKIDSKNFNFTYSNAIKDFEILSNYFKI